MPKDRLIKMFVNGKLRKKSHDHDLKRTIAWISTETNKITQHTTYPVYFEVQSRPKKDYKGFLATYRDGTTKLFDFIEDASLSSNMSKHAIYSAARYVPKTPRKVSDITWTRIDY